MTKSLIQRNVRRFARKPWLAAVSVSALLLAIGLPNARADKTWDGGAATNNWMDANNWNANAVPSAEQVVINFNTAAVTLNVAAPNITNLTVANSSGSSLTSSLTLGTNASLSASYITVGANNTSGSTFGILTLDGGTLTGTGAAIGNSVANTSGGSGTLNVNSGTLTTPTLNIGTGTMNGAVVQAGGTVSLLTGNAGTVVMAIGTTANTTGSGNTTGSYTMSGGTLTVNAVTTLGQAFRANTATVVGNASGTFTQTAGDVSLGTATTGTNLDKGLQLAAQAGFGPYKGTATGVYKLYGGTLTTSGISMGLTNNSTGTYSGSGTFEFGDANGTGTLLQRSGGARNILVRVNDGYDGTFTGWGTVGFTGTLTNNGRIIANGFGTSRSLDFSSMTITANTIENGTGLAINKDISGWYAINKGKLHFPGLTVNNAANTYTVNIGEAVYGVNAGQDADIDLVNSLTITFTKAVTTETQKINVALLDTGHSDVVGLPMAAQIIGIWDINPTFAITGSSSVVFRYDDALAASLGLAENDLKLYHYSGGWQEVLSGVSINTTKNQLTATGLTGFSQYAIGAIPEPASLGLLAVGSLMMLGRNRRRA